MTCTRASFQFLLFSCHVLLPGNPSLCGRPSPCHTGSCDYNQTINKHVCVCPSGLIGDRCQTGNHITWLRLHSSLSLWRFAVWYVLFSDINECTTGQHNCDVSEGAICNNTHGSFLCHCRHGYCGEDGRLCKGNKPISSFLTTWMTWNLHDQYLRVLILVVWLVARNDQQVLLEKMATGRTLKSNALYFRYQGVMAIEFERKRWLGLALSKISHFTDTTNKM